MRALFLRGRGAHLAPLEPRDEAACADAPWRLLSTGGSGEEIGFAVLDDAGRVRGVLRLERLDWIRRDAAVTLRGSILPAAGAEALRLVTAYAHDELNLELLEARIHPSDGAMREALAACGFRPGEAGGSGERHLRPLP